MMARFIGIQCAFYVCAILNLNLARVEGGRNEDDDSSANPKLGFWFDVNDKFTKCRVKFEDFFACCHKAKCTKNQSMIMDCCTSVKRRSVSLNNDDMSKCVFGVEEYLKQECNKLDRDYCPYDSGLSSCCTHPPCNMKKMKEKYCCKRDPDTA